MYKILIIINILLLPIISNSQHYIDETEYSIRQKNPENIFFYKYYNGEKYLYMETYNFECMYHFHNNTVDYSFILVKNIEIAVKIVELIEKHYIKINKEWISNSKYTKMRMWRDEDLDRWVFMCIKI